MADSELLNQVVADWQAACRADEVLRNLPVPDASALVEAVLDSVHGPGGTPDVVLSALASGLAAVDWHASGEVLQLQVGSLMGVVARLGTADARRATHVHMVLSAAAARVAVEAWRNRAEQDELTGLRNRAGWERDVSQHNELGSFQYASIDLDGLKAINDGPGGHAAGDDVLRDFARRLEVLVNGAGGSTYRYGGDEFSAVLPMQAGDLCGLLDGLASTAGVPAFSHGVARWPEDDPDLQSVVSMADRRMYDRKKERKSR